MRYPQHLHHKEARSTPLPSRYLIATKGKGHKGCYNEPLLLQLVYLIAISLVLGLGCELILGQHRLKILTTHKSALVSSSHLIMEFSTSQVDEEFSNNDELYNGVYRGPAYEFTSSVTNFKRLPR